MASNKLVVGENLKLVSIWLSVGFGPSERILNLTFVFVFVFVFKIVFAGASCGVTLGLEGAAARPVVTLERGENAPAVVNSRQ